MLRLMLQIILAIAIGASLCLFDGYLKCRPSGADGARTFTSWASLDYYNTGSIYGFVQDCVDYGALIRIEAIVLPIFFWSMFYTIQNKKVGSAFQVSVEVLAIDDLKSISRNQAKQNLHVVREFNARHKIENVLFDRLWY